MLIWDDILQEHNIVIKGVQKAKIEKYLGGTALPNKSVTAEQAEVVAQNYVNPLIADTGYHIVIHIFSFPKKTEETVPLVYIVWLGLIGTEPVIFSGNTYWWEPMQ